MHTCTQICFELIPCNLIVLIEFNFGNSIRFLIIYASRILCRFFLSVGVFASLIFADSNDKFDSVPLNRQK